MFPLLELCVINLDVARKATAALLDPETTPIKRIAPPVEVMTDSFSIILRDAPVELPAIQIFPTAVVPE